MVVRGGFAVPRQICSVSPLLFYNKCHISFDSRMRMLLNDVNKINVGDEIHVCTRQDFKNCNFQEIFLIGLFQSCIEHVP